jgi:hypothetical protein
MDFFKENELVPGGLEFAGHTTRYKYELCMIICDARRTETCLFLYDFKMGRPVRKQSWFWAEKNGVGSVLWGNEVPFFVCR